MNTHTSFSRIIFLTGQPQEGKSTLLERLLKSLPSDLRVSGILAHGHWDNGIRSGFTLRDLKSRRTFPLARRGPESDGTTPFVFDPRGVEAGLTALAPENNVHTDIIVVDEIGKLELQGPCWGPCLQPLLDLAPPTLIWVVRQHLLTSVAEKWNIAGHTMVQIGQPEALETLTAFCLNRR